MNARYATKDEIATWNSHNLANPDGGNVFSSYEFAQAKLTGGYKVHYLFAGPIARSKSTRLNSSHVKRSRMPSSA